MEPGEPQDQPPPQYQPPPGPPGYPQGVQPGYPYAPPVYPEESQALASLLMSLLGLVICSGLLCPVGWYMANKELDAISQGRRDPTKRDMATAGKVIGIIGTALLALGLLFVLGFVILIVVGSVASAA